MGGSLAAQPEQELEDEPAQKLFENNHPLSELERLSHLPWQCWRGPYQLGYILKTSTFLCFVIHLLGSNDNSLWKGI
jgi:hypothetical protein